MNMAFIYNDNNKEIDGVVKKIINYCLENKKIIINENKNKKIKDIKIITKITSKSKYEVFLIFSNDIDEINELLIMNKNLENVLIFTNNLKTEYILKCIEITSDICYLNNDLNIILNKIIKVLNKKIN